MIHSKGSLENSMDEEMRPSWDCGDVWRGERVPGSRKEPMKLREKMCLEDACRAQGRRCDYFEWVLCGDTGALELLFHAVKEP